MRRAVATRTWQAVITRTLPATERRRGSATATRAGNRTAGRRRDGATATRPVGAARREARAACRQALRRNRLTRLTGRLRICRRRLHPRGRRQRLTSHSPFRIRPGSSPAKTSRNSGCLSGASLQRLRCGPRIQGPPATVGPFSRGGLASDIQRARVVNEIRGINRVVHDVASKPPGTIAWA